MTVIASIAMFLLMTYWFYLILRGLYKMLQIWGCIKKSSEKKVSAMGETEDLIGDDDFNHDKSLNAAEAEEA